MATAKQLETKQDALDVVKWIESKDESVDTCGTYPYCLKCDKTATYPCARAYFDYHDGKKAKGEFTANVALSATAQKLRALRLAKDYSIAFVGKSCGIEPSEVFKFENDKAVPTDEELHTLILFFEERR